MSALGGCGNQGHEAEAALVIEGDLVAVLQREHHVVVRPGEGSGAPPDEKVPRHAEMTDHHLRVVEIDQEVLCPAPQPRDPPSRKAPGEVGGKRDPEIRPAHLDIDNALAAENGFETPADSFDFRKFRHEGCQWPCRTIVATS